MNKALKIILIVASIALAFLGLLLALAWNQPRVSVLRHRLFQEEKTSTCSALTPYSRPYHGKILAADSTVIAQDADYYDFYVDCLAADGKGTLAREMRSLAEKLAILRPTQTTLEWWEIIQSALKSECSNALIAKNFSSEEMRSIQNQDFRLNQYGRDRHNMALKNQFDECCGYFMHKYAREYPYGNLARRAIGYSTCYEIPVRVGLDGKYDERFSNEPDEEPKDMLTTLDMDIQAAADKALRSQLDSAVKGACLVVMEVKSGAIRAMVNMHLNRGGILGEYYNYAIGRHYEPGFVASAMTLAVALQDGIISSLDDVVPTCGGNLQGMPVDESIKDYERTTGKGEITVADGFRRSSPYVMSYIGEKYKKHPGYYIGSLKDLCLSANVCEFDIDGLRDVAFPSPDSQVWTEATVPSMAFGCAWTVTPLHILGFYNTIANNGVKMMPYLIQGYLDGKDDVFIEPKSLNRVMRPDVAAALAQAMNVSGTSSVFKGAKCKIAGKSGISRQVIETSLRADGDPYTGQGRSHEYASTFAGFFPADNPQYSVVCVVFTGLTSDIPQSAAVPEKAVRELVDAIN